MCKTNDATRGLIPSNDQERERLENAFKDADDEARASMPLVRQRVWPRRRPMFSHAQVTEFNKET